MVCRASHPLSEGYFVWVCFPLILPLAHSPPLSYNNYGNFVTFHHCLSASGIILMIVPLANLNFMIPGPIIGVAVGLTIFGLRMAKGIRTARTAVVAAR